MERESDSNEEEAPDTPDKDPSNDRSPDPDAMTAAAENAREAAQTGRDEDPITEDEDGLPVDNPSG